MRTTSPPSLCVFAALAVLAVLGSGPDAGAQDAVAWKARDLEIASRFAPIFHQGVVSSGRYDYITNFDFDGDWVGDNNWANAERPELPLKAYVYYAVSETPTHFFIHYAAFHPRDYKGGEVTGALLSQAVRRGAERAQQIRRTSIADELVLAHENDLEGCLVVAEKRGPRVEDAVLVAVETLAHNRYQRYLRQLTLTGDIGAIRVDGERPMIYIEPKGHGMEAFADQLAPSSLDEPGAVIATSVAPDGADASAVAASPPAAGGVAGLVNRITGIATTVDATRRALNNEGAERIRIYRFTGHADDPDTVGGDIGYALLPIYDTLWAHAKDDGGSTFGVVTDFGTFRVIKASSDGRPSTVRVRLGRLGSAFLGREGALNMARPPWGWFDATDRTRPPGEWFFDPAGSVQRRFAALRTASTAYVHQPFLGIIRTLP